jgi:hypothetical protein
MSNEHRRDHGKLFAYTEKPTPSHPDFHGDCVIDGTPYEIRGWNREEQLEVAIAPPRGDKNTFPLPAFKGRLDAAPPKPVVPKAKGKKGKGAPEPEPESGPPTPAWSGIVVGDDVAYEVRAFDKQGKSGNYFTLSFEKTEKPTEEIDWVDAESSDT